MTSTSGTEPSAATTERPTISERLLSVADGNCACGGEFKWTGVQMRCERCNHHMGYGVRAEVRELAREAAAVVKRHA